MITIKEAEEILKKEYHVDNFLYVVDELLLPDFRLDKHDVDFKNTIFTSVQQLGYSDKCDVNVYEVILKKRFGGAKYPRFYYILQPSDQ